MKRMAIALLALVLLLPMLARAETYYVTNPNPQDSLHMRRGPTAESESVARYYPGTPVEMIAYTEGGFSHVRVGVMEGYMESAFLSQTPVEWNPGQWAIVNVQSNDILHLRAEPSTDATSLGRFFNGTTVQILEDAGEFYRVRGVQNDGYMSKQYLVLDGSAQKPVRLALHTGLTETEDVNVRSYPDRGAALVGTYPVGTMMDILGMTGVWYYVRIHVEEVPEAEWPRGFVLSQFLHVGDYKDGGEAREWTLAVIRCPNERDRLLLWTESDGSGESLGLYYNTTQLEVLDTWREEAVSEWLRVRLGSDGDVREGFMQSRFMALVDQTPPDTWDIIESDIPPESEEEAEPILGDETEPESEAAPAQSSVPVISLTSDG